MTSTNTTTTAAAAGPNLLQKIEDDLTADWQWVANFIKQAVQFSADFMAKVASGAEIVIADVEQVGQLVAGNLTSINAGIAAFGTIAAVVAPNHPGVAKLTADMQTAADDVALMSQSLSSGSTAGDPAIVTTAVTTINAVNQLAQMVSNAHATLGAIAANSPTATQTVTAAAPSPTA